MAILSPMRRASSRVSRLADARLVQLSSEVDIGQRLPIDVADDEGISRREYLDGRSCPPVRLDASYLLAPNPGHRRMFWNRKQGALCATYDNRFRTCRDYSAHPNFVNARTPRLDDTPRSIESGGDDSQVQALPKEAAGFDQSQSKNKSSGRLAV